MKLSKSPGTIGLIALAVLAIPCAAHAADEADDAGWYVGAGIGQSKARIDDAQISASLAGNGFATTSIDNHRRDTGYKVFGGYQFNRNFAVEGGYFDLGRFGYTATTIPAGTLNGSMKAHGLNIDLVGILPITEKFSAFGRAGVTYAETQDSFRGTGLVTVANPDPSKRDTNFKLGVGMQYSLTEALALRAEAERYRINDAVGRKGDVDLYSVGLVYRFGKKAPVRVVQEPMPEPVAVVPTPPPVVAAPPPPPKRVAKKVSFSADSLFDFNKSDMRPAGRQEVDKLAADLKGASFDNITVTGYTDRIGSHGYNQKLSKQRAEVVKTYLAESSGIPADKVTATGAGESDPITKPDECKGTKKTRKLVTCLAPDRRVEVEVAGTK